ncbi:MAG TPA: DUF998 domain-containing protein [Thermoplasmata archaeon]|nr:DUF998 domain-containing protein [Thermoplasmata archaeon]
MSERTSLGQRIGAILIAVAAIQFVGAMAWVQTGYPGYSLTQNYISDLGNTSSSPLHVIFNVSIVLLGLLAIVGIALSWGAFPRGGSRPVGLLLLLLASVAAIVVGFFPENVNGTIHDTASDLVFVPGGIALVVLSFGMRRPTWWTPMRWPSLVLGAIMLASILYYAPTQMTNSTADPGLIERFIVVPLLIWAVAVSVLILRRPSWPRLVRA